MSDTARLETFSDGIFAIAATLLILDVNLSGDGSVAHQLVQAWPSYAAYAISFATLGIVWVNHHTVFKQIGSVDRTFLFINVLFLMVVAFTPFPTRVLADNMREQSKAAAVAYGLTYTSMAVCFVSLWFYAAGKRRLIAAAADQRMVSGISRSFAPGAFVYAIATLSALLSAVLAVVLFAAIAIFYVIESSFFGRE
ncbi:MAG TPA: TMEM175 family protein [Gaiellaceae bacterium]